MTEKRRKLQNSIDIALTVKDQKSFAAASREITESKADIFSASLSRGQSDMTYQLVVDVMDESHRDEIIDRLRRLPGVTVSHFSDVRFNPGG